MVNDMKNLSLEQFENKEEIQLEDEKKQYVILPAYIVVDTELSGNAKAILSYVILRKRNPQLGWKIIKNDVINNMKESETAINTAFNNLIERGYLIQSELFNDPKTGNRRRIYKFFLDPKDNEHYKGELPSNEFYKRDIKEEENLSMWNRKRVSNKIPSNNDTVGDFSEFL